MNISFRHLNADEIECRIATCGSWGVQLLLYKNARVDMAMLDEAVGALNWTREHKIMDGKLFCRISIYNPQTGEWIHKEDVGTENYTEKEKSQASDSFKRCAVNWGIGRELYSAPVMFISADHLKTLRNENGKWKCNDIFKVTNIQYNNNAISYVQIINCKTNEYIEFLN